MNAAEELIARVRSGELDFATALGMAAQAAGGVVDIGCARVDHARSRRCGFPEFIYGAGKQAEALTAIVREMVDRSGAALATRLDHARGEKLAAAFPEGEFDPVAGTFMVKKKSPVPRGRVLVIAAGTSDAGPAREALHTLQFCDIGAELISDVGVAGLERLFAVADRLRSADACIVVAGMEGALPSVVGGLVKCPVIAVPTSVGYGMALGGLAALAGMLNSCAAGITVVNIDNGFGAACAAVRLMSLKPDL